MSLAGRCALITGATGTLGTAIANAYCRAGARVLLSSRRQDALQALAELLSSRHRGEVSTAACDLSSPDQVRRLADDAVARFGRLDVLVNTAAMLGPIGPTWENKWTDWHATLQVNLCAPVQLCGLCVPHMSGGNGRGKIVNISGGGASAPRPRFSAYAASKAALVRFSETLAAEVADRSIDVNCVAPGLFKSPLTEAVAAAGPDRAGRDEYDTAVSAETGVHDQPWRAADLCTFLASDASDGITGKFISARWDPWPDLARHRADLGRTDVYTLRRIVPRDRGLEWDAT